VKEEPTRQIMLVEFNREKYLKISLEAMNIKTTQSINNSKSRSKLIGQTSKLPKPNLTDKRKIWVELTIRHTAGLLTSTRAGINERTMLFTTPPALTSPGDLTPIKSLTASKNNRKLALQVQIFWR